MNWLKDLMTPLCHESAQQQQDMHLESEGRPALYSQSGGAPRKGGEQPNPSGVLSTASAPSADLSTALSRQYQHMKHI